SASDSTRDSVDDSAYFCLIGHPTRDYSSATRWLDLTRCCSSPPKTFLVEDTG
ncbi:hypothetical protein LSAT2_008956, partial [Lamellibrachia satsuma]